jgi:hypothetical protein
MSSYKGTGDAETGWERVLYGYIPTHWSQFHTQENTSCISDGRGNEWTRALIKHMTAQAHTAWTSCCNLIHKEEEPRTLSAATRVC